MGGNSLPSPDPEHVVIAWIPVGPCDDRAICQKDGSFWHRCQEEEQLDVRSEGQPIEVCSSLTEGLEQVSRVWSGW